MNIVVSRSLTQARQCGGKVYLRRMRIQMRSLQVSEQVFDRLWMLCRHGECEKMNSMNGCVELSIILGKLSSLCSKTLRIAYITCSRLSFEQMLSSV